MKKKLLLLLTPLLLVSSCGNSNYSLEEQRQNYEESLSAIATSEVTAYDVKGEGHAGIYDCNPEFSERQNVSIPTGDDIARGSLFLRMPLRIVADAEIATKNYERISTILSSKVDSNSIFYIDNTETDNFLHVYAPRLQKKNLTLYRVDSINDDFSITARFSIHYYYNEFGFLVKETIQTINSVTSDKDKTVDLVANYTYH